MMQHKPYLQKGQMLVEVAVAVAIIAVVALVIVAAGLSAETIEAIRQIAYSDDQQFQGWNRIYCPPYGNCAGEFPKIHSNDIYHHAELTDVLHPVSLSAGVGHTCVVAYNATVWCWGTNSQGQLGDGTINDSDVPVQVNAIENAIAVGTGASHTCALLQDGTVWCWGSNTYGQLGDGTTTNRSSPVIVAGLSGVVRMAAGRGQTCAVLEIGQVFCWGSDVQGELGDNALFENKTVPVPVENIQSAVEIGAGDFTTCAVLREGTAYCWGVNHKGQLGNGSVGGNSPLPVQVQNISDALTIDSGGGLLGGHSCVATRGGLLYCWGDDARGQLGNVGADPEYAPSPVPVAVSGITNAVAITTALQHSCALLKGGAVRCWGAGVALGDDQTGDKIEPVSVVGFESGNFVGIANYVIAFGPETIWRGERSFTRYFIVENVCREGGIGTDAISGVWQADPATECAAGSYDDPWTQRVTVFVKTRGIQDTVISQYVTRSTNAVSSQADWSGGPLFSLSFGIRDFLDLTPPSTAYDVAHNPVSGKFGVVDIYAGQLRFALCPDANCTGPAEAVTIVEASAVSGDGGGPYLTFNGLGK